MAKLFLIAAVVCFVGMVAAEANPTYFYPVEHRTDLRAQKDSLPSNSNYDFELIPNDQYAVAQYDADETSFWDYIPLPNPITCLTTIGSKALVITSYLISKSFLIMLGAALVIGFCAFTPYCTLIIEAPFSREMRSLSNNIPYLDEVEDFLSNAYHKYQEMQ